MDIHNAKAFKIGMKNGIPIALGYFAVSFSLGIAAKAAGLTPLQGAVASFLNNASAGEYALFSLIAAQASVVELILVTLVANGRYILMSCTLGQRFADDTPIWQRMIMGFDITDELFSMDIMAPVPLNPFLNYGTMLVTMPAWALGTALGIIAGNVLPARVVSALGVALYGMFIASFVPPAKENNVLKVAIPICFMLSYLASRLPWLGGLSEGSRAVILTVLIASALATAFPLKDSGEAVL